MGQKLSLAQRGSENLALSHHVISWFQRNVNRFLPLKMEFQASRPKSVTAVTPELMEGGPGSTAEGVKAGQRGQSEEALLHPLPMTLVALRPPVC